MRGPSTTRAVTRTASFVLSPMGKTWGPIYLEVFCLLAHTLYPWSFFFACTFFCDTAEEHLPRKKWREVPLRDRPSAFLRESTSETATTSGPVYFSVVDTWAFRIVFLFFSLGSCCTRYYIARSQNPTVIPPCHQEWERIRRKKSLWSPMCPYSFAGGVAERIGNKFFYTARLLQKKKKKKLRRAPSSFFSFSLPRLCVRAVARAFVSLGSYLRTLQFYWDEDIKESLSVNHELNVLPPTF